MSTHYDLDGRVAVITGATGGFGVAISQRLRDCGATVIHWDLPAAVKNGALGDLPHAGVDISDAKASKRLPSI